VGGLALFFVCSSRRRKNGVPGLADPRLSHQAGWATNPSCRAYPHPTRGDAGLPPMGTLHRGDEPCHSGQPSAGPGLSDFLFPNPQSFPYPQLRPSRFFDLSEDERSLVRSVLERDLPMPLDCLLDQIADEGSLAPWSWTFDPPSLGLPNEPAAESLQAFCEAMRRVVSAPFSQLPERGEKPFRHCGAFWDTPRSIFW
jgi:hypothetical protein